MTYRFCVLLEVETNDPRLSEDALEQFSGTVQGVAQVRRALLQHLPKDVQRVVAIMPIEQAKALSLLHDACVRDALGEDAVKHPPPGYVPPTRD